MRISIISALILTTAPAAAQIMPNLSISGAYLGRITADQVQNGLALTIDLGGDVPQGSSVIARFQTGQPFMLGADGNWTPWSGDIGAMADDGFTPAGSQLTFHILPAGGAVLFWPAAFTLTYRTPDGLKFGTLIVDEPVP